MYIKLSLIILFLLLPSLLIAQPNTGLIDRLLTSYSQKGQFDGSILIARGSKIVYSRQYGLANRQFKVPITETTKFPIASITKLYTAILILKLQEEGKLDINSPLSKYLPDLIPKISRQITIKQLLTHVSGLLNETGAAYEAHYELKDYIKKMVRDTLLTKPGSKYVYNNVNYILLGEVIATVTHQKWENVLYDKIINPLHLLNTGVIKTDSVIENLAYGYHNYAFGSLPADPLKNDDLIYMENYATAGAIFTTPDDLLKLHLALVDNSILSRRSKELMYAPEMAIGKVDAELYVTLGSYTGTKTVKNHSVNMIKREGNINGFNAMYLQLPDTDQVIIIFCNTDAGSLSKITDEVLALVVSAT